ncbi:MAG: AmmeMemoRadiSam system protein B, partial [Candidatus Lindowbacteria bacterium]|nr:AmmeMemoRadiSam system protein B [Candidatus Lindowbacteria bacterium]
TDLTHYGPSYGFEPKGRGQAALDWVQNENDSEFLNMISNCNARGAIDSAKKRQNACCPGAVAAAISATKGTHAKITDSRTSQFRRGGTPEDFVGYGGALLYK